MYISQSIHCPPHTSFAIFLIQSTHFSFINSKSKEGPLFLIVGSSRLKVDMRSGMKDTRLSSWSRSWTHPLSPSYWFCTFSFCTIRLSVIGFGTGCLLKKVFFYFRLTYFLQIGFYFFSISESEFPACSIRPFKLYP